MFRECGHTRLANADMSMPDLDDAFLGEARHHSADRLEGYPWIIGDILPVHGETDFIGRKAGLPVSCKQVREEQEQALMRVEPADFPEMCMPLAVRFVRTGIPVTGSIGPLVTREHRANSPGEIDGAGGEHERPPRIVRAGVGDRLSRIVEDVHGAGMPVCANIRRQCMGGQ